MRERITHTAPLHFSRKAILSTTSWAAIKRQTRKVPDVSELERATRAATARSESRLRLSEVGNPLGIRYFRTRRPNQRWCLLLIVMSPQVLLTSVISGRKIHVWN